MFETLVFIIFVVISFKLNSQSRQIRIIQKQISTLKTPHVSEQSKQTFNTPIISNNLTPQQTTALQEDKTDPFLNWIKENWLLKLGVLLLLVGFGWFVSYAFIQNWIGPIGRIALGFVIGSCITLFGSIRIEKNMTQGKLFLVLGSAIVIITSYAAQAIYGFFTPPVALGIIFLVSVYVSSIAFLYKNKSIAIYALALAILAPLLTHSVSDIRLLFMYLIVISIATIWLASLRGWKEINSLALFGFCLYAFPYVIGISKVTELNKSFVLISIFVTGFIYFLVSIFGAIKNQEHANENDIFIAILDSTLIILCTIKFVPHELQSLIFAGWMIVFAMGSFIVFQYTNKIKFFYVYSLISVLLLVIATATELKGSALVYAFIIESAIISIAGYLITRKIDVGYNLSLLMIGPIIMSFPSLISSKWNAGVFHDDFGILFLIGVALCGLGLFYYFSDQEAEKYNDVSDQKFYVAHIIIGSLYFLALVWLSCGALFDSGVSTTISLTIFTIIGIPTYFYGLAQNIRIFKYYGGVLLLVVVARLVLVDVWHMELAQRIITFTLIGILFISTAFIGNKFKKEIGTIK